MKTAISIPDDVFELVELRAAEDGVSRSECFTRAVRRYLAELDEDSLPDRINAAIDLIGPDQSAVVAVAAGRRVLSSQGDWSPEPVGASSDEDDW